MYEDPIFGLIHPDSVDKVDRTYYFRNLYEIGRGGFGVVYNAIMDVGDGQPERRVILKQTEITIDSNGHPTTEQDLSLLRHAQKEEAILEELNTSNVGPRLIGSMRSRKGANGEIMVATLVMEDEGVTLDNSIGGLISLQQIFNIARQALTQLEVAHQKGWVHRDLKRDNMLLNDGKLTIIDWGGAARPNEMTSLPPEEQRFGTPAYMAPEQLSRPDLVSPATDFYSLGIVLAELLTGETREKFLQRMGINYLDTNAIHKYITSLQYMKDMEQDLQTATHLYGQENLRAAQALIGFIMLTFSPDPKYRLPDVNRALKVIDRLDSFLPPTVGGNEK